MANLGDSEFMLVGPTGGKLSRRAGAGLLSIIAGLVAQSCGGEAFIYRSHVNPSGGDSYYKVPSTWTVFDQQQIFSLTSGQLPATVLRRLESQTWSNIIAGEPHARLNIASGLSSTVPYGITQQIQLTSSQSSTVTIASLRSVLLPSDPLAVGGNSAGLQYQVMSYHEFRSNGFTGSNMEVKIISSSGQTSVLDQKAMLDSQKKWIYFMGVGCTQTCFAANKTAISQVVSSWNVKER